MGRNATVSSQVEPKRSLYVLKIGVEMFIGEMGRGDMATPGGYTVHNFGKIWADGSIDMAKGSAEFRIIIAGTGIGLGPVHATKVKPSLLIEVTPSGVGAKVCAMLKEQYARFLTFRRQDDDSMIIAPNEDEKRLVKPVQ